MNPYITVNIYRFFPEPLVIAFRLCENLKDMLVRARLATDNTYDERDCTL